MRIEQLEYLAEVARLGSFRRAAEQLHISQPALSESIRTLERELGVELLERGRHGARVKEAGQDLLPHIRNVLESVDRLRHAAGEQYRSIRVVRLGTVTTATVPLLAPAIRQFRQSHAMTQVEVVVAQQDQIHNGILSGSFDLGLVNYLEGDDVPPELETTTLLRGRPVVCMRADSHLAAHDAVQAADLQAESLIAMRSGYLMHRFVHRLLGQPVAFPYAADGAEMGKLMVAEGLGLTVLPDFSVHDDPLEQRGLITWRPIADDTTQVKLVIQRAHSRAPTRAVGDMHRIFVERARVCLHWHQRPMASSPVSPLARPACSGPSLPDELRSGCP